MPLPRLNSREDGTSVFTDRETGKPLAVFRTLMCRHCGAHFHVIPGSGRQRGWCMSCGGPTCGKVECDPCVYYLQKIDNLEAGRDWMHKPVSILVPDFPYAADSSEVGDFSGAAGGFNVGPAGDPAGRDSLPGIRPEALDGPTAGSPGLPVLPDTPAIVVGPEPVDAGAVDR